MENNIGAKIGLLVQKGCVHCDTAKEQLEGYVKNGMIPFELIDVMSEAGTKLVQATGTIDVPSPVLILTDDEAVEVRASSVCKCG